MTFSAAGLDSRVINSIWWLITSSQRRKSAGVSLSKSYRCSCWLVFSERQRTMKRAADFSGAARAHAMLPKGMNPIAAPFLPSSSHQRSPWQSSANQRRFHTSAPVRSDRPFLASQPSRR
eukprot:scaffold322307_cov28-Tisochrysis_lutea.AAC.1